ncbi:MAG: nitric oxide reductase subunit B [Planctomycetota bacterium]|jgi:nitric oxide reductase subunit B
MTAASKPLPSYRRLWIGLGLVLIFTFSILGWTGREIYRQAPPIPDQVVTTDGQELMTQDDILTGQQVWQSMGGQQMGSVWGHGAYQAPDWSADWLHREAIALRDILAQEKNGSPFSELPTGLQAQVLGEVKAEMRHNGFDEATGKLTISPNRAAAMRLVATHYVDLFGDESELDDLREDYALHDDAIPDLGRRKLLTSFFSWTAWTAAAERPGSSVSYTNNWPHEPLVGNVPSTANVFWSVISIIILLIGIGALVWYKAFTDKHEDPDEIPKEDPLDKVAVTPSMKAVAKYAYIVVALFVVQVLLGAVTAHYTVEGKSFFGFPLAEYLPYSLVRTWHLQTALFWIATAFLGAGLFLAPIIGGKEPKYQRLGVNVLWGALIVVVVGSLTGEFLAIHQKLSLTTSFWFGHQGYEYVDLGRFWQILFIIGAVLWLVLMARGLWPALQRKDGSRSLILLFTFSTFAIGLFYMAALFIGARTHLTIAEYWRWWVVHLWVEGFFEVFATAAIAFLFARMGLVKVSSATRASLFSTSIFLVSGIPGTAHHLYFCGTPISAMAIGASFSALEVVPLVLIGFEAWETFRSQRMATWTSRYRWPIMFFVGVSFWNLVGAGIFGFLINPPISLYYMQGLNTTPVHAHTALFGVYGLLSLGLILVILRRLTIEHVWKTGALRYAFWTMNIGLGLMVLLSLLPIGLMQTWASIEYGMWYARSAEFMQQPHIETLRWMRVIGDTVFMSGVGAFAWFVVGLKTGRSFETEESEIKIPKSAGTALGA